MMMTTLGVSPQSLRHLLERPPATIQPIKGKARLGDENLVLIHHRKQKKEKEKEKKRWKNVSVVIENGRTCMKGVEGSDGKEMRVG